jgi:hypothetical protein
MSKPVYDEKVKVSEQLSIECAESSMNLAAIVCNSFFDNCRILAKALLKEPAYAGGII